MKNFRLLDTGQRGSFRQMAVDEALLESVAEGTSKPVLRFYRWNKPAVAIGYFQSVEEEVDVVKCREDGVEIFRRMTGGGAVYKDPKGELNYTLVIPENFPAVSGDIRESYGKINSCVVKGLSELDIDSEHSGINDITVGGRKISGNAQTRKKGVILQHGTVLLDFDAEKMVKYLRIAEEKSEDKASDKLEERVRTLRSLKPELTMKELKEALSKGFSRELDCNFSKDCLTDKEEDRVKRLRDEKYATEDWNFMR